MNNNNQSSNNTNKVNKIPDNGGANTPSLSGINKSETDNRTLAAANSRKGNLGKREVPSSLPSKGASPAASRTGMPRRGGGLPSQGGLSKGGTSSPGANLARKAANLTPVGRAANLVRNLAGGKKQGGPLGLGTKTASSAEGDEEDKEREPGDKGSIDEQDKRDKANEIAQGEIKAWFSRKTILLLSIMVPIIVAILMFLVAIIATINENKVASFVLGNMMAKDNTGDYSEGDDNTVSDYNDARDELNKDDADDRETDSDFSSETATGTGPGIDFTSINQPSSSSVYPPDYFDRLATLGNNFTSLADCEGDECLDNPEFLYYLKVADLANRYKNKYNVDLNWYLLIATDLYNYETVEEGIDANQGGYDTSKVDDYSTLSQLDWDTDFGRIDDYRYLDPDDSTYDLAILAKNMVKKTTTQFCGGKTSKTVTDVEDEYLEPGGAQALDCSNYSFSSTYELDLDKYDEFLLEYIDKKFLGSGIGGNSLAEAMINLAVAQLDGSSAHGGGLFKDYMGWGWNSTSAWCAAFVSWVVGNAEYNGTKLSDLLPVKYGVVADWANYLYNSDNPSLKFYWNDNTAKYKGKNGSGNYTPKPGDMIFFDWECTWDGSMPMQYSIVDHIGLVQRMDGNQIVTIEGNWGNSVYERYVDLDKCIVVGFGSWYD